MPSSSKSQYKLMQFAAINAKFAEKKGIKQETAKEWHESDKKKKAEDPEWYENLPEKFEKKKEEEKGEVSNESIGDAIAWLFHGKKQPAPETKESPKFDFRYDGEALTRKTYLNDAWLESKELKTGPINASDISHKLNYPTVPTNLIDTTEKYITVLGEYMLKYSKAVHHFANDLANAWDGVRDNATPEEAEAAVRAVFKKRSTIDRIPLPMHGLGNLTEKEVQEHDEYSRHMKAQVNPGVRINTVPALTKGQIKKAGQLIVKVFDYVDKHSDLWHDERTNHFDFKDEWKRMSHYGKEPDDFVHAMNLAGFEGTMFENDDIVRNVLLQAAQALDELAKRSIK